MRRITLALALALASALSLGSAHGWAQDGGAAPAVGTDVQVDPVTGERWRWERPEEPLRRGSIPVAGWVALAGGAVVALAAAAALVVRARRRRRR